MSRRPGPKGAEGSGARAVPWRLLHQDPSEDRSRRPSHRLRPDRRRKGRCAAFPNPARARPRYRSARCGRGQGECQQGQSAGGTLARHHPGHSAQGQREGQARLLRESPLSRARPHRAGRRQAQAPQACRPALRKDQAKLHSHRRPRRCIRLGQIRPHRLNLRCCISGGANAILAGRF